MINHEMDRPVFTDELVKFTPANKEVSLLFRHLGIGHSNQEEKLTVDTDVLGELFERLEILNRNPAVADRNTKIVIDYRSLGKRLTDPKEEIFPGFFLNSLYTILGSGQTVIEGENERRLVYVSKLPTSPGIFNPQKHMEKEIRHELQHLAHTYEYFQQAKEPIRKFIYYLTLGGGSFMLSQSLYRISNFESTGPKDMIGLVGGVAIMIGGYQFYRRSSPIENEARIAEGVLKDKRVFIWPNEPDANR